jgi:hypothetical protein
MSALLVAGMLSMSALAQADEKAPAPRDHQSGLPTGQRMHKPYTTTAETAKKPTTKPTQAQQAPATSKTEAPTATPKSN